MTTLMTIEDRTSAEVANYDRRWWILGVLGVAQLMVILDSTIVNIALPTTQADLHFSNADRQWIVTAYSLAFGTLLLLGGRIGDRAGRKRTLIAGLVGFALASAIGGASVNFSMLVIARTVQGAFGALLSPSVLAILTTTFTDPDERGKAFGIYGAVAGAGGALGLLLGGLLTFYASWRWTLFINLPFACGAITGTLLWFRNDQGADNDPFDLPGLLLVGVGLFSLVFGLSHAETTSWSDPYTAAFLVVGVVALAVFAVFEASARFPLLPPRVVLNRTRGGSLLVTLLGSVGVFGLFLFLTYYLQGTLGFSPVKTGILFLPMIAAVVATAQVSNRVLLPRFGPKPVIPLGLLLSAGALFGLHLVGLHTSYLSHVLPFLLVMGVGSGLSISMAFSTGTLGLAPQDAGVGSATLNTAQMVGGSIGTALLNTLAASASASYLASRAPDPANLQAAQLHGYTTVFLWCAVVFAAAALIAALVLRPGNLKALLAPEGQARPAEPGPGEAPQGRLCRVRISCR